MSYLEDPPSESNTPQEFKIGDTLSVRSFDSKVHEGIVDTIEWSITFKTWCYRLMGGKNTPYWVYEKTNHVQNQFDVVYAKHSEYRKRPPARPPIALPPPIAISE